MPHGTAYFLGIGPNLATYDNFVNAQAALNPSLPRTTGHAVVATANQTNYTSNAPSTAGIGVYLYDGMVVRLPSDGSLYAGVNLSNSIRQDQYGNDTGVTLAWTGFGSGQGHFPGNTNTFLANRGNTLAVDGFWHGFNSDLQITSNLNHMYALSEVLTVACTIPSPAAAAIAPFVVVPMLLKRRRRA